MPKPKYVSFYLVEVIYFMKEGDFSFFDFKSDHGQGYAEVLTKEAGWLCIYDVSDKVIPAETVRRVLDVMEHWDECLEQAYDWLRFYDIGMDEWNPANEQWTQDYNIKKEWSSYRVEFGEKACQEPRTANSLRGRSRKRVLTAFSSFSMRNTLEWTSA